MNPLAAAVDGARWVRYEPRSRRVFVWKEGGELLDIVDEDTGEVRGNWPCEASPEGAERKVTERLNAGY